MTERPKRARRTVPSVAMSRNAEKTQRSTCGCRLQTPLLSRSGGYPINVADAATENFNGSESRTRFIYASGFTATTAFNGATLETYDAASATSRVLGALPGSADFGSDFGVTSAIGGPGGIGAAFAARSSGGSIQQTGAKVYSFDLATTNSLKATTTVK